MTNPTNPIDQPEGTEAERRLRSVLAQARLPEAPETLRASLQRVPSLAPPSVRMAVVPRWSSARGLPIAAAAVVIVALLGSSLAGRFSGSGATATPTASHPATSVIVSPPASLPGQPTSLPIGAIPWTDASPGPDASPAPRPIPAGTRTCGSADLTAVAFWEGATGSMAGGVTVTNVSPTACVLDGPPKAAVIKAGSLPMPATFHGHSVVGVNGDPSSGPSLLQPGDRGGWVLSWTNWCGADLVPTSVVVTLPGGHGEISATPDADISGAGISGTPRCDAPGSPSSLEMNGFEYDPPQPPAVVPQPATAVISAPATANIDSVLSFTVSLTNNGDAPAALDPCPVYDEDLVIDGRALKLPGAQRYRLNCDAIGPSIAPGATVVLEMHYLVPADLQPGPAELSWDIGDSFDGADAYVPIQLVQVPALTVDHPTVTVTPSTALVDRQTVTVSVTGFGIGGKVWLSECSSAAAATSLGCGAELARQTLLVTDDSENGSATFTVTAEAASGALSSDGTRACASDCVIVATLGADYPFIVAPISFGTTLSPVQRACPGPAPAGLPPGLDCDAIIAAAIGRLPSDLPPIASIEVHYGSWCPVDARCGYVPLGDTRSWVVFHFETGYPLMVGILGVGGHLVAGSPVPYPIPVCTDPSSYSPAPGLTCTAAINAAASRLPANDAVVITEWFTYGSYCPPGDFCVFSANDHGYVVFYFADQAPLMVAVVSHASTGNIVTSPAEPFPPTP